MRLWLTLGLTARIRSGGKSEGEPLATMPETISPATDEPQGAGGCYPCLGLLRNRSTGHLDSRPSSLSSPPSDPHSSQ